MKLMRSIAARVLALHLSFAAFADGSSDTRAAFLAGASIGRARR